MTRLRVGMGDSYGLRFTVFASDDFLPATVTGAVFHITKPNALKTTTQVTWTASIGAQSSVSVQALYAFAADGLDLDYPGTWRAWIQWIVPGETPGPRSEVASFIVVGADAL